MKLAYVLPSIKLTAVSYVYTKKRKSLYNLSSDIETNI
jgi:hypothetical protein